MSDSAAVSSPSPSNTPGAPARRTARRRRGMLTAALLMVSVRVGSSASEEPGVLEPAQRAAPVAELVDADLRRLELRERLDVALGLHAGRDRVFVALARGDD